MANFDPNFWYQLTVKSSAATSMDGTPLYDHLKGSVFLKISNVTSSEQQWQLFPFNSTYYVLRTRASGPKGYMTVAVSSDAATPGNTVPEMRDVSLSDNSMFWTVSPWADGTFFLANAANGTKWNLNAKNDGLMSMSSNITAPQNGQRFLFSQLSAINDPRFSSVALPSSMNTSTATNTSTPSASTSASSSGHSGLSTGAAAGIGVGIAAVVLVAVLVLGFIILRRRKQHFKSLSPSDPNNKHDQREWEPPGELDSLETNGQNPRAALLHELDHSGPNSHAEEQNWKGLMPQELDPSRTNSYTREHNLKMLMPHEFDQSRPNSHAEEQNWIAGMPHDVEPETRSLHEMEAGERRQSPFRPGNGEEQKAVMPQGILQRNATHELDGQAREGELRPEIQEHGD